MHQWLCTRLYCLTILIGLLSNSSSSGQSPAIATYQTLPLGGIWGAASWLKSPASDGKPAQYKIVEWDDDKITKWINKYNRENKSDFVRLRGESREGQHHKGSNFYSLILVPAAVSADYYRLARKEVINSLSAGAQSRTPFYFDVLDSRIGTVSANDIHANPYSTIGVPFKSMGKLSLYSTGWKGRSVLMLKRNLNLPKTTDQDYQGTGGLIEPDQWENLSSYTKLDDKEIITSTYMYDHKVGESRERIEGRTIVNHLYKMTISITCDTKIVDTIELYRSGLPGVTSTGYSIKSGPYYTYYTNYDSLRADLMREVTYTSCYMYSQKTRELAAQAFEKNRTNGLLLYQQKEYQRALTYLDSACVFERISFLDRQNKSSLAIQLAIANSYFALAIKRGKLSFSENTWNEKLQRITNDATMFGKPLIDAACTDIGHARPSKCDLALLDFQADADAQNFILGADRKALAYYQAIFDEYRLILTTDQQKALLQNILYLIDNTSESAILNSSLGDYEKYIKELNLAFPNSEGSRIDFEKGQGYYITIVSTTRLNENNVRIGFWKKNKSLSRFAFVPIEDN